MKFTETPLSGAYVIEPVVHRDDRGFFLETYNQKIFSDNGIDMEFVQDNHSLSKHAGVLRGLHFQREPHTQSKLLRVISGAIYDVIVDVRQGSKTFGKWFGVELSEANMLMLLVPRGFAHGFCTLTEDTHVLYKVDSLYAPQADSGIRWNDPELGIDWPTSSPVLSEKDKVLPFFNDANF